MAIVRSLAIGRATGSMGGITYRTIGGETISSQKRGKSSTKPSYAQASNIVSWANAVNFWQAFEGNDRPSFEGRRPRVSDFNEFIAASRRTPVYLTRPQAQQGGCVVAPYIVTRGSLPSIEVTTSGTNGEVGTDISLGSLNVGGSTTIKQISDAIINNNEGFVHGDAIVCFVARQSTNSVSNVPYTVIDEFKLTLDQTDNETLVTDFDPNLEVFCTMAGGDKLGMSQAVNGGAVYIHTRLTTEGTKVSTQSFVVNNTLLVSFTTDTARNNAIASYGGSLQRLFLTPDVDMAIQGI